MNPVHHGGSRYRLFLIWLGLVVIAFWLASLSPLAHIIGRSDAFTLSREFDIIVEWLLVRIDPFSLALRTFLIKCVLIPMRDAYLWLPFSAVVTLVAAVGWRIGGMRSALVSVGFIGFIAMSGWWDRAMITAYIVSFAIFLAVAIGLPLGVWAAASERRSRSILLVCDSAQTFPSFIYLIPVVMLFGVNDVAVIAAVIIFALVPMVRYTIEGLRDVPLAMLEAADMAGASQRQKLWFVKLPIALPTIMIGLNQTVLFSLFMVIIAAFIGTQDLGQEMQRALSSTDVGKGLVLGLCVAFMGLMADHLILRWSKERKRILGLE